MDADQRRWNTTVSRLREAQNQRWRAAVERGIRLVSRKGVTVSAADQLRSRRQRQVAIQEMRWAMGCQHVFERFNAHDPSRICVKCGLITV